MRLRGAIIVASALSALAQGTVRFDNNAPGSIVTHVYQELITAPGFYQVGNGTNDFPPGFMDWTGWTPLAGKGWSAQLWAAPTTAGVVQPETSLGPASPITDFQTGPSAGFVTPMIATLMGVPADAAVATLQLRVWDNHGGEVTSWEAALNTPYERGTSPRFNVSGIGGLVNPPPTLQGLGSFNLHPYDYTYTTNNGTITITKYTGNGGDVTIPAKINGLPVTSIADGAFWNSKALTSVVIPHGLVSIGKAAFDSCSSLKNLTMPNSVTIIPEALFRGCSGLAGFTIPKSVTSIGDVAFTACDSLTNLTIPNSVKTIGNDAFNGCHSLTNIAIGNGVSSIGQRAFHYCNRLTGINVATLNQTFSSVDGVLFDKGRTTVIRCPPGKAGNVVMPNSVSTIQAEAFSSCPYLTSISISTNVTSIGYSAFANCTSLTSLTIPYGVTSIAPRTFDGCSSMTNFIIPDSVTSIGDHAFSFCSSLTSLKMGADVTSIGSSAFLSCNKLASVAIPDSVTSLGSEAFEGCTALTNITIPKTITNIAEWTFAFCYSLRGVYFKGNAPVVDGWAFDGTTSATLFYLPGTTGWGTTLAGRPTAVWQPLIADPSFSALNQFGFKVNWASGMTAIVEGSTDLTRPAWPPLATNTLASDSYYFSDAEWTNYPKRFYRIRSP